MTTGKDTIPSALKLNGPRAAAQSSCGFYARDLQQVAQTLTVQSSERNRAILKI